MAEHGNTLVFHTTRKRYTTEDGLNHQSQLTLIIDTENMCVINDCGEYQSNHVSHSFDQYIQFDGNNHVLVDHGDAYPRSIVLHKSNYFENRKVNYSEVDLFTIPGNIGDNYTGVSVGGFEMSSSSYIVAMNSIDHVLESSLEKAEKEQRDIIICSVPKNKLSREHVKQIMLARYTGSEKTASMPQLVKISDDRLMVLWQEYNITCKSDIVKYHLGPVKYVFINGNGEICSDVKALENFRLSECKPIVYRNTVIFYTNENGIRNFYTIPLDTELISSSL